MRKLLRSIFRSEAKKKGVKPSRYVAKKFNEYQTKIYGAKGRKLNQIRGTHKVDTWRTRIRINFEM